MIIKKVHGIEREYFADLIIAINNFNINHDSFATNIFQPINNKNWTAVIFYNEDKVYNNFNDLNKDIKSNKIKEETVILNESNKKEISKLANQDLATIKQINLLKQLRKYKEGMTKKEAYNLIKNFKEGII